MCRATWIARVFICVLAAGWCAAFSVAACAQKSPGGIRYGSEDEIILQGFHWNSVRMPGTWYDTLKKKAPQIAADGFTIIWLPPVWQDTSSWKSGDKSGGGEGYFWGSFNKNSGYGTNTQLKEAIQALKKAGIKLVYDVVPNHMDRSKASSANFLPKTGKIWRRDCDDKGAGSGPSPCDDGDPFMSGDSDFNLGNADVEAMFEKEFINLRDNYSASGLRFDFVRGYAPRHVQHWMSDVFDNGICIGEMWKSPGEFPADNPLHNKSFQDGLKDWSDHSDCMVFDFALKDRMQNGSISEWRNGLNGNPEPRWRDIAVTFVDNHDTGPSPGPGGGQHIWPIASPLRKQAYAYILSSPGTPAVYWPDMYGPHTDNDDLHDYLRLLIQTRRTAGIRADSDIRFPTQCGSQHCTGLVAVITGSHQQLLVALNSNLAKPDQVSQDAYLPALSHDDGKIRIWHTGPAAASVNVTFRCDNGKTQTGDSVYVVGSSPELGNWDPAKAVRLTDVSTYPTWKGSIALPGQQGVEWKCIIRNEADASQVKSWQPGSDNEVIVMQDASTGGAF
ncbi:DUF1921 domain-containing protein [Dyella sp. M7H15-1]|uniref:glucan 1,4-alpha-maltotetraohydrolase domain-containing protein n=1 Tax=Dyella sp. M7H15-1 TaxID=2501295 RepID=UPI001004F86A|nr:glucan 1,4-alpha-maltotetraohydrolase domain-containing protein [Dyella sp. M7H15-1]QAU25282.1 DUF1921 domain-containing protein [Dyella sp. M7H15-1]